MNWHDGGGPAFPVTVRDDEGEAEFWRGMSLRDWFAGQALAGLLSDEGETWPSDKVAQAAYDIADAMLRARKKGA